MDKIEKYKEFAYLLGCYMVIADKEINALEVNVLDHYLTLSKDDRIYEQRQMIFSDDEEKVSLSELLSDMRLLNLTTGTKEEVISLLSEIAYGDDYLADQEKDLLEKVSQSLNYDGSKIIKNSANKSEQRVVDSRLSKTMRVVGKAENFLINILPYDSDSKIDLLLGSLGYSATIEDITDNAIIDLNRVSKIINKIDEHLTEANKSLKSLNFRNKNCTKEVAQVASTVFNISKHFDELICVSLKDNAEVLNKKRRNIRYFTLAFMGRTKAGKSTLHKVITQQKNDDIGVGKLRTTRYNRSWYWNKLRVVDTPGIGAPGGATDTEIAKSIIDEADVICYIVTSDSIQETEFDFFETIKERNKPLYIILNVKSNLSQSIRLKRFLEAPDAWRTSTGPQSIQGHIDRIHERLDGKYNMDAVEIIPIHLLAAQMGFSDGYGKDSQKLIDGSNIFTLTRSIKSEVQRSGGLKKSLSVVDGTSYQIHQISKSLLLDYTQLKGDHDILVSKRNKLQTFIDKEKKKLFDDLRTIFNSARGELRNRASSFAQENYDNKNASNKWQNDSVVKSIFSRMNDRLKKRIEDFNDRIKSEIEEVSTELQILGTFSAKTNVNGEDITNTRLGVGVFGAILSAAAPIIISQLWHPGGWILAGATLIVGLVVSFFTSLFDSKAEKIRKATDKMRNELNDNIDKSIKENTDKLIFDLDKSVKETNKSIATILNTYIDGTALILKQIEVLNNKCVEGESAINSLVSFRILEYVGKRIAKEKAVNEMDNDFLIKNYPVIRDWEHQSIIYQYSTGLSDKDRKKAEVATQMKIISK